ncbi:MAG: type II 3-dehydroquinate dehydratase [Cryomorphaceae bacterium]|nr:type II 3-dehydroquinate dehydratase [Cryomorphaceae bacterium]
MSFKIDVLNGPNLNLLGTRESNIYGSLSLNDIEMKCRNAFSDQQLHFFQSNVEGDLINALHASQADAIVLNAGGYTHTSVAIRDAIASIEVPVVELHISNIAARESFRHESLLSPVCSGIIFGFGTEGYPIAINACLRLLNQRL